MRAEREGNLWRSPFLLLRTHYQGRWVNVQFVSVQSSPPPRGVARARACIFQEIKGTLRKHHTMKRFTEGASFRILSRSGVSL